MRVAPSLQNEYEPPVFKGENAVPTLMRLRWQRLRWHSQQENVAEQEKHPHRDGITRKERFLLETTYLKESLDHPSAHPSRLSFCKTRTLVDTPLRFLHRGIIEHLRHTHARDSKV